MLPLKKLISLPLLSLTAAALISVHQSQAAVIISHNGSTNPVSEGWTANGNTSFGSAIGDAWNINDNSNTASLSYQRSISNADANAANTLGWSLSATFQVADINNAPNSTRYFDYVDTINQVRWGINLGSNASGDAIVTLRGVGGFSISFSDAEPLTLTLSYNPTTSTATLYNASQVIYSGYSGEAFTGTVERLVRWGSTSSFNLGNASYQNITFATVPEPSTVALLSVVAGVTVIFRRKVRR